MIAAVDIDGFVLDACDAVYRKYGTLTRAPTVAPSIPSASSSTLTIGSSRRSLCAPSASHAVSCRAIIDNASIHKDVRIQNAIEAAGADVIWTAAYSPDLNPIERCFVLYKKVLIRQHRAFSENPHDTHLYALENLNCVSPKIMCNLYMRRLSST